MNINTRLKALEVAQAERPPVERPKTEKELAIERAWGYEGLFNLKRRCDEELTYFIKGRPATGTRHTDELSNMELLRVAWLCGQQWLRYMADVIELERDELPSFTPERIAEITSEYRNRADVLDRAGVPDMSIKGRDVPIVAGGTWLERLAWAVALGDELDAELKKVRWFDCWPGEMERMRHMHGVVFYASPLSSVPPLPDDLLAGLMEKPDPQAEYA